MPELLPQTPSVDAALLAAQNGRLPLKLRRSLAALSLVGAALVALPVTQLLRYQAAEEKGLLAARTRLDPMGRAIQLQRGLLAHRDLAAQVLGGRPKLEPERVQRQAEVDGRMAALMAALAGGQWDQALDEAEALQQDWRQLIEQLRARRIDVTGNAAAHRLSIEQTLQIIDIVTAETASLAPINGSDPVGLVPAANLAAMQTLPRLIWQTSLLAEAPESPEVSPSAATPGAPQTPASPASAEKTTPTDTPAATLDMLESRLARTLGQLEKTAAPGTARSGASGAAHAAPMAPMAPVDRIAAATRTPEVDTALLRAVASAGASSERYFNLLRGPAAAAERQAARQSALQAQMGLFDLVQHRAETVLASQGRAAAQRRALLYGGMSVLALLALATLGQLWRGLLHWQAAAQAASNRPLTSRHTDAFSGDAPTRQAESDGLIQRLRVTAEAVDPADGRPAAGHDPAARNNAER